MFKTIKQFENTIKHLFIVPKKVYSKQLHFVGAYRHTPLHFQDF